MLEINVFQNKNQILCKTMWLSLKIGGKLMGLLIIDGEGLLLSQEYI